MIFRTPEGLRRGGGVEREERWLLRRREVGGHRETLSVCGAIGP